MIRSKTRYYLWFLLGVAIFSTPLLRGVPQGDTKPVVAVIYADWCPLCQKLKPILARINERYQGEIHFVLLDVTSEATTAASRQEARKFGLESFFDKYHDKTSTVAIQDGAGREVFRAVHDYEFQHYAAVLDQQLRATAAKPGEH